MIFIGIDPGVKGGIAAMGDSLLEVEGNSVTVVATSGLSKRGIYSYLDYLRSLGSCKIVIEKVSGYVEGSMATAASSFVLGGSYHAMLMALEILELPYREITPQQWQKAIDIPPRKKLGRRFVESSDDFKRRLKLIAQELYDAKLGNAITLETCDALLIARYCKSLGEA